MKADAAKVEIKKGTAKEAADSSLSARAKSEIIAWFWVILAFMLINGTLGQARVIPSGSMENTLLIGDHLIMSRIGYDAGIPFTNTDLTFPYKVPNDCYFAMGDNRGNSYDSRFWGCVPRNDILGTPVIIYMSLNAPKDAWNGDIGARFLAYANALIHPGTVRWRRLFHLF